MSIYISYFCHDAKRRGGGGPRLNVIMTLIFKNSLEVPPYRCLEVVQTFVVSLILLKNVEHCGGEPEQVDTGISCH